MYGGNFLRDTGKRKETIVNTFTYEKEIMTCVFVINVVRYMRGGIIDADKLDL